MITRTRSKSVVFSHPFELRGVDRTLPPGEYKAVTDEQLIEELSFPVYRRVATMIFVPGFPSYVLGRDGEGGGMTGDILTNGNDRIGPTGARK
jgi:hypothetical protein